MREWQLHEVSNWGAETGKMLLLQLIKGLEMSNNIRLTDDILDSLPTRMKMSYFTWLAGQDLKQILPPRTFYRYRTELKKYDVDIAIMRDVKEDKTTSYRLFVCLKLNPLVYLIGLSSKA